PKESFMLVQFEGARDLDTEEIEADVNRVFLAAQVVGRQHDEMDKKIVALSNLAEDQNQKHFLEWLLNGNFICFGYAAVDASGNNGGTTKAGFTETPLGWLPPSLFSKGKARKSLQLTAEAKELFARKNPLVVEVLDEQSPLYQQDNLIYIGFRECCKDEKKTEHLLVGLFSQNSINEMASNVPPLRDKLLSAFKRQDVQYESYDYRKVVEIFNTFPKVEMFFLKDKELDSLVKTFVSLQRHQSVRLVVTRSLSLRGFTLLAIMPRDYYSRESISTPNMSACISGSFPVVIRSESTLMPCRRC
ncbi:MAG: NAD-glutamate dehydrogenase, partial [Deltaproteobacteria bacterium]|nr:NAD-glutamate dehydrogenase [Deltaproteobacteria bacterium]